MRVVRGTFPTYGGAAQYVGLGFVPKKLSLYNITEATALFTKLDWSPLFRANAVGPEGKVVAGAAAATANATLVLGAGVIPYRGGDAGDGTAKYIIADPMFNKQSKGSTGDINAWTSDVVASKSGHFNAKAWITAPDPCGVGSVVTIEGLDYIITTLTNNGDAAGEVVLHKAAPSGSVGRITGINTHIICPTTMIMPAGFYCAEVTYTLKTTAICYFEASDE